MNKVLDNRERAKNAIVSFYVVLVAYILVLGSDFAEYQLLQADFIDLEDANSNDRRQLMIAILAFFAQLALIITFIQWFRRAYHNLHKAGEKNLLMSEGWASGAWFVPILSLFRPYQIMVEIWERTQRYAGDTSSDLDDEMGSITHGSTKSSKSLVGWWWALWIISSISANISTQLALRSETLEDLRFTSTINLFSDVTGIICILFAVKMIKESQEHQNHLYANWENKTQPSLRMADSDDILI